MRPFDIQSVRDDFPILSREVYGRPLVYLDNAATAQKPRRVVEAMNDVWFRTNANIHRAAHRLADETTALYEAARDTVKDFIGAQHREEIIFTSGATASLNIAACSLCRQFVGEGDNIVVSRMEHHSNIVPWQLAAGGTSLIDRGPAVPRSGAKERAREITSSKGVEIRVLPFTDEGLPDMHTLEDLIDERTRIVAITQCSNVLGTRPDIRRIADIAHRHGAIVVVDGSQGAVHGGGRSESVDDRSLGLGRSRSENRVDVRELDCDMYAFTGHKLYGPTGIGVLYGKKALLESIPPFLGGGDMVKTVSFSGTTFADLPFKFEAGTANFVGAIGLAEAIKYLTEFDVGEIAAHEHRLLEVATAELSKIDGLTIYGTAPDKAPILSFTVESTHASDIGAVLDKLGIAVRTGTHCAQPLLAHYGQTSVCRASFAIYNTVEEAFALAEGVAKAVKMLRR